MRDGVPIFARFTLRPESKRPWFYRVIIFHDRATMHAFCRDQRQREGLSPNRSSWAAMVSSWRAYRRVRGRLRRVHCIGQILFYVGRTGSGVVSHEMTHAALYYLKQRAGRRGVDVNRPRTDERLAFVQGELVRKFWRAWYARRLDQQEAA